jgi:hypothetical protein
MRCAACDAIYHPAEIRDPLTREFICFEPLCFNCNSTLVDEDGYLDRLEESLTKAEEGIKLPYKTID